jgi:WD40 repeat protein
VPRLLPGHADWVNTLAFSPDSRWLATGSADRTAHLWDLNVPASRQASYLVVLSGHTGSINALAFSPDSRWLVTGSEDKTGRLWLVQVEELKSLACRVTGRNFSQNEWQRYFPGKTYHKTCEQWPEGR